MVFCCHWFALPERKPRQFTIFHGKYFKVLQSISDRLGVCFCNSLENPTIYQIPGVSNIFPNATIPSSLLTRISLECSLTVVSLALLLKFRALCSSSLSTLKKHALVVHSQLQQDKTNALEQTTVLPTFFEKMLVRLPPPALKKIACALFKTTFRR